MNGKDGGHPTLAAAFLLIGVTLLVVILAAFSTLR